MSGDAEMVKERVVVYTALGLRTEGGEVRGEKVRLGGGKRGAGQRLPWLVGAFRA
jgi:hypothetical protein